jgi:hypothetical protein
MGAISPICLIDRGSASFEGMSRPSRRAFVALAALGALAVGLALLYRARLPLAEALVRRIVAAAGVAGAELRVVEVGPRGALLEDVRVGAGPDLEIARLALRWSLLELVRGHVGEAAIGGLRARGRIGEDGGVTFGALDAAASRAGSGGDAPATTPALPPLEGLVLHDALVELSTPKGVARLRVDGRGEIGTFGADGRFALRAELGASRAALALELAGEAGEPRLQLRDGSAAFEIAQLGPVAVEELDGTVSLGPGGAPFGSLHAGSIRTTHTGPVEVLLALGEPEPERAVGGRIPFQLGVKLAGGRVRIDAPGVLQTAPFALEASVDHTFSFAQGGVQPADLWPGAAPLLESAVGDVAVKARVKAGADPLSLTAHVESKSLDLVSATGVPIEGLAFAADVTGPSPLRTKEHVLTFRSANLIGPFENGTVRWRLEGSRVEVLAADWTYAGGRLTTAGPFDLSAKEWPFAVDARGVSLEALLAQLEIADLSGSGSLSGALPLVYDGTRLRVEHGVLTAEPPGGVVRYAPASAAPGSFGLGGDVDVLTGALEDFHYDRLRLTLDGALDGDVTVGLEIDGRNPRYEGGRPVELNVKVDTNLPALLRASRSVSGVPEVIERRLRGRVPGDG